MYCCYPDQECIRTQSFARWCHRFVSCETEDKKINKYVGKQNNNEGSALRLSHVRGGGASRGRNVRRCRHVNHSGSRARAFSCPAQSFTIQSWLIRWHKKQNLRSTVNKFQEHRDESKLNHLYEQKTMNGPSVCCFSSRSHRLRRMGLTPCEHNCAVWRFRGPAASGYIRTWRPLAGGRGARARPARRRRRRRERPRGAKPAATPRREKLRNRMNRSTRHGERI